MVKKLIFSIVGGLSDSRRTSKPVIFNSLLICSSNLKKEQVIKKKFPFFFSRTQLLDSGIKFRGFVEKKNINKIYGSSKLGFLGFTKYKNFYYFTSYAAIYKLNEKFELVEILVSKYFVNLHAITILNDKTYLPISLHEGDYLLIFDIKKIVLLEAYKVDLKLQLQKINKNILKNELYKKNPKNSHGRLHFNFCSLINNHLFLTSRTINSLLKINLKKKSTKIISVPTFSPILIHDGIFYKKSVFFTSIQGLILEYDLKEDLLKIKNRFDFSSNDKTKSNWCRGLDLDSKNIYYGNKGLYNSKNFEICKMDRRTRKIKKITFPKKKFCKFKLRFANVFSVSKIEKTN